MSHEEVNEEMSSETAGMEAEAEESRYVPVTESIRYRRRAQAADRKTLIHNEQ